MSRAGALCATLSVVHHVFFSFYFRPCRSVAGEMQDEEDDPNLSPETKAERERLRRQANNNRERYAIVRTPLLICTPRGRDAGGDVEDAAAAASTTPRHLSLTRPSAAVRRAVQFDSILKQRQQRSHDFVFVFKNLIWDANLRISWTTQCSTKRKTVRYLFVSCQQCCW